MDKAKIKIEYPLRNTAINALWNSISSPFDMCEWFADSITVEDDIYTFSWNGHEQSAKLIHKKVNEYVRFQWLEDADTHYFFEIKIAMVELTGDVTLIISDFADKDEKDDVIMLWNQEIDVLKRRLGI